MAYEVAILPRAQKELGKLPRHALSSVAEALRALAENPRPPGCSKLAAREGWRIRVGDYRAIYEIDDAAQTVTVLHLGDRRDVYKRG